MNRPLLALGLALAGVLWPWLGRIPWGRLPGDIVIEKENFRFHFPLTTGLVVSAVLTLILWLLRK